MGIGNTLLYIAVLTVLGYSMYKAFTVKEGRRKHIIMIIVLTVLIILNIIYDMKRANV